MSLHHVPPFDIPHSHLTRLIAVQPHLDNHLRNTLPAQRLTALERLSFEARKRVENRRDQKKDGSSN